MIELYFQSGLPAWSIKVPQPRRFENASYDLRFRAFFLPGGVLLGCWLRLFDVPEQPYFVHRVLDLGDELVRRYVERLAAAKRVMLVFHPTGTDDDGFSREVAASDGSLAQSLTSGLRRADAGEGACGEEALGEFMSIFNAALIERGDVGLAWDAVAERHSPREEP